jgi:transcriptional antiterminator NusG
MDKQEPENQQLEEELVEPAEEVSTSSDESGLNDTDASVSDEEPASVTQAVDETEANSTEEDDSDVSVSEETEEAPVAAEQEDSASDEVMNNEPEEVADDESVDEVSASETTEETLVDSEADDAEVVDGNDESESEAEDDPSDWFVVHCYSGYENKVRHNLEQRIETMGMKDMIFDVVVPTQEEIEVKDGKRRTVERHIFPGYVLVNMILTEESWYVVRNTPGVTGFVGMGNNPTPLRPEEVAQIVKRMEADAPTVKVTFKVGERVRIIDGPFNDFRGVVAEIDMERTKVRVMVSFFGRETPVELDFLQVEKA